MTALALRPDGAVRLSWLPTIKSLGGVAVPRKIRELIADLEAAGFENRGGKGSHRNFLHPKVAKPVTLSGKPGDDASSIKRGPSSLAIAESRK
jgi:predicted RNA binding protein YcfA (HicA-like mRNA interferase family)